jgi:hypothetical protein
MSTFINITLRSRHRRDRKCSKPRLESLEGRLLPTARIWSGLAPTDHWTSDSNWVGGVAPKPGDDLIFPTTASQKTNTNDFSSGRNIGSIDFEGAGFTLQGNSIDRRRSGAVISCCINTVVC